MNKIFILFFFVFVFVTLIDSLPHNVLFEKRAPSKHNSGKFLQCPGDYPINYTQITYTPKVFVPGKTVTERDVWDSTVTIDKGVTAELSIYLDNELVLRTKSDYCQEAKVYGLSCPISPGHYDKTFTYKFPSTPKDPKHKNIEYLGVY